MPSSVHLKIDAQIEESPLEKVKIGDHIVIYPHKTCPVDGVVDQGHGSMMKFLLNNGVELLLPQN